MENATKTTISLSEAYTLGEVCELLGGTKHILARYIKQDLLKSRTINSRVIVVTGLSLQNMLVNTDSHPLGRYANLLFDFVD